MSKSLDDDHARSRQIRDSTSKRNNEVTTRVRRGRPSGNGKNHGIMSKACELESVKDNKPSLQLNLPESFDNKSTPKKDIPNTTTDPHSAYSISRRGREMKLRTRSQESPSGVTGRLLQFENNNGLNQTSDPNVGNGINPTKPRRRGRPPGSKNKVKKGGGKDQTKIGDGQLPTSNNNVNTLSAKDKIQGVGNNKAIEQTLNSNLQKSRIGSPSQVLIPTFQLSTFPIDSNLGIRKRSISTSPVISKKAKTNQSQRIGNINGSNQVLERSSILESVDDLVAPDEEEELYVGESMTLAPFHNNLSDMFVKSNERLKVVWERIIQKYSDPQLVHSGDIIDLQSGSLVEDNGHLRSMTSNRKTIWSFEKGNVDPTEEFDVKYNEIDFDSEVEKGGSSSLYETAEEPESNSTSQSNSDQLGEISPSIYSPSKSDLVFPINSYYEVDDYDMRNVDDLTADENEDEDEAEESDEQEEDDLVVIDEAEWLSVVDEAREKWQDIIRKELMQDSFGPVKIKKEHAEVWPVVSSHTFNNSGENRRAPLGSQETSQHLSKQSPLLSFSKLSKPSLVNNDSFFSVTPNDTPLSTQEDYVIQNIRSLNISKEQGTIQYPSVDTTSVPQSIDSVNNKDYDLQYEDASSFRSYSVPSTISHSEVQDGHGQSYEQQNEYHDSQGDAARFLHHKSAISTHSPTKSSHNYQYQSHNEENIPSLATTSTRSMFSSNSSQIPQYPSQDSNDQTQYTLYQDEYEYDEKFAKHGSRYPLASFKNADNIHQQLLRLNDQNVKLIPAFGKWT